MTLVKSKEFAINQDKYFDLVLEEQVFIPKDNNMFHLFYKNINDMNDVDDHDDDYITKDELLAGIHDDIDIFYANK